MKNWLAGIVADVRRANQWLDPKLKPLRRENRHGWRIIGNGHYGPYAAVPCNVDIYMSWSKAA